MVEDRKQKPNLWDNKQRTSAASTQMEQIVTHAYSAARSASKVFMFACGFLCGVGTVLLLIQ